MRLFRSFIQSFARTYSVDLNDPAAYLRVFEDHRSLTVARVSPSILRIRGTIDGVFRVVEAVVLTDGDWTPLQLSLDRVVTAPSAALGNDPQATDHTAEVLSEILDEWAIELILDWTPTVEGSV